MADNNQTIQALAKITDAGLFERLATAVLREANPVLYANVTHTGVNVEGKTVKEPVDNMAFVPAADPPHMVAAQHTTCAREHLRKKWLHDPSTVKPRKGPKPAAGPGDVIKTAEIVEEERVHSPTLRVTLALTTNEEPPEELIREVHSAAERYGIEIDIWSRSRLAHFLDTNPDGQWLRRKFLGMEQERLSKDLLRILSRNSLELQRPPDNQVAWVERYLDRTIKEAARRAVTFVIAESGSGKSIACYKHLDGHVSSGGFGLVLPHDVVAAALTVDQAVDMALRQLHPTLAPNSGSEARLLCPPDRPLLLVVEDVNKSGQAPLLLEKLAGWKPASGAPPQSWRILCPVWPQMLAALGDEARKRIETLAVTGATFTPAEGCAAVQRRASLAGTVVSSLGAEAVSAALGHDPLLIALRDPSSAPQPHRVIGDFVDSSLQRTVAARREYTAAEYRNALRVLARTMLKHRNQNPTWGEVRDWVGQAAETVAMLRHVAHQGEVLRLVGGSSSERLAFRHDRVREWLLIDTVAQQMRVGHIDDEILADPFLAEVIGAALVQDAIPVEFVERVRMANPLALFHALQTFKEPIVGIHHAVLAAINTLLSDEAIRGRASQHLRWEALQALSETESTQILDLVQRLGDDIWPARFARLRNGDFSGGVELCRRIEPGSGAPWRDRQIEHAKLRYQDNLTRAIGDLFRRKDLSLGQRVGALRLAGHLADSTLAGSIETSWKEDPERDHHLADYLWASAECCGDDPQRLLGPVCDAWASLSDEPPEHGSSPRNALAADSVRWAFQRALPEPALRYFISRAQQPELRWPITYMLHGVDHPEAVEFLAKELAATDRRLEGTGGFSPFATMARDDWRRRQDASGKPMSSASRQRLLQLWQDQAAEKHLRRAAFRLWTATVEEGDLDILKAVGENDPLADFALRQRLRRGDQDAIPALLAKLSADEQGHPWFDARYVASERLIPALEQELTKRSKTVAPAWDQSYKTDYATYNLLMRLPADAGEALLLEHWQHLHYSPEFVQAALYIASPRLCSLVAETMAACPDPKEMLRHVTMHFGIRQIGHPGVTRIQQVEALVPYVDHLGPNSIHDLWTLCNERGWFELRRRHIDPRMRDEWRHTNYVDDTRAQKSLDDMLNNRRGHWIDFWIDDFLKAGASLPHILDLIAEWSGRRRTIDALELAGDGFVHAARREDLQRLLARWAEGSQEAAAILADTSFAVQRRSLI